MHRATLASDSIYASIRDKEPCCVRWLGVARDTSRDPMPLFARGSRRAPHATPFALIHCVGNRAARPAADGTACCHPPIPHSIPICPRYCIRTSQVRMRVPRKLVLGASAGRQAAKPRADSRQQHTPRTHALYGMSRRSFFLLLCVRSCCGRVDGKLVPRAKSKVSASR